MLIKTRGIVLRTIKYSETSLIVDVFTEERGLQKYIVSGVRSRKAKTKASLLQVMSLLDMVAYHRDNRDLHRVKELRPALVYRSVPFDVVKGAVGLFIAEVARKAIRQTEENRELFDFLFDTFCFLDATNFPVNNLHLYFLAHLTSYLGFTPGDDFSEDHPYFNLREGVFVPELPPPPYGLDIDLSGIFYALLCLPASRAHEVTMTGQQRRELLDQLINYYRLHIENFPDINAHQILREVLEG